MRVLFTTTPGWGHVHPMVPLARALLERGDTVAWAAAEEVCGRLRSEHFEASPAGLGADESRREFYRRFPEFESLLPKDRPAFMFPRLFGAVRARPMLQDLLPLVRSWRPDLIVHDAGELAGPIAAALCGLPNVVHAFGGLIDAERMIAAGAQVAPLWEAHGLVPRPYAGSYDHLYLDIYPPSLQVGPASHVPFVQPLRPVAFALRGDEPLPEWLQQDPFLPLVYVTFGTVFNTDTARFAAVIEGLRTLDVRVLVTVGAEGNPDALGEQPGNVHIARYVPQTAILSSCAAVVSHAGSGTFLAALAHGLPQVCLPLAADQFRNAAACARSGAGLALDPGVATATTIRDAARRVLSEPQFRAEAKRLRAEIARMPDSGSVAGILERRFASTHRTP